MPIPMSPCDADQVRGRLNTMGIGEEDVGDAVAWARSAEEAALQTCAPIQIRGFGGYVGANQSLPNNDKQ